MYQAPVPAAEPRAEVAEALRELQHRLATAPAPPRARSGGSLLAIGCGVVVLAGILALVAIGVNGGKASLPALTTAPAAVSFCGSNTIAAELAPALVEAFLLSRGGRDVRRESSAGEVQLSATLQGESQRFLVAVRGAGTGTAFQDLNAGKCDVAMASRAVLDGERSSLGAGLSEHVLGLDGIAVIVHASNRLEKLDTAQLAAVFAGRVTNFAAVGGSPGPIELVSYDEKSGTYDTFRSLVLANDALSPSATRLASSAEVLSVVTTHPNAIAFTSLSAARGVKALSIAEPGLEPLTPSAWTIARESYALTRRLFLYTHAQRTRPAADALVAFALSAAGQSVVSRVGFVDLSVKAEAVAGCAGCPAPYLQAVRGAQRLSVDFRFQSGSSELDSRAVRDADRVVEFARTSANSHLQLLGFADARGAPTLNQRLSLERAERVRLELTRRGLSGVATQGIGSLMPLASNDTEEGRQKNRRVEVWLKN